MSVLMGIGPFRFRVMGHAYETLERSLSARWEAKGRIGRRPAMQFVGPGEDEISITATLYPELTGGLGQVEAMRAAADAGRPMMMVSGAGRVFGRYCLTEIADTASFLTRDGTPRKVEVTLKLKRYGEDGGPF